MNEIVLAAARMAANQLHEAKSDKGKTSIADIFDAFLEHIDEQAKRIAEQVGDIKKLKEDLSEVWQVHDEQAKRIAELEEALSVIEKQTGQIATLKAALIEQIAQDKIAQMGRFGFVLDSTVCDPYGDARKQLAREYPHIAWEEKK